MKDNRSVPVIIQGALFGGVFGLVFGLLEVFFALALIEDFFRWGMNRYYVTHWEMAFSILALDILLGIIWGSAGSGVLLWLGRREGPWHRTAPFLCFWNSLIAVVLYPTFFLYFTFLSPMSRFAPYWLPITIVWVGLASGLTALLFYLFAHRYRAAGSQSLNLFLSVLLSTLVLGAAYLNSSPDNSIISPRSLLVNSGLLLAALLILRLVLAVANRASLRRGIAAAITLGLAVGTVYVGASSSLPTNNGSMAWANSNITEGSRKPDIILIVLDTQRLDRLGFMNPDLKNSPHLDDLSRDSVIYKNCITPSSWTLPSHASMFTGLYPTVHAAEYRLKGGISPANPDRAHAFQTAMPLMGRTTLAEILRDHGYDTGAVCGNCGYLSSRYGMDAGFEFHDSRMPQPFRMKPAADLVLYPLRRNLPYDYIEAGYKVEPQRKTYRSARSVASVARWWLNQNLQSGENREPMFLFLNFCDPHAPYIPPYVFDTFPGKVPGMKMPSARDVSESTRKVDASLRSHLLSAYDGEVCYMDYHIGLIIKDLKDRNVYDQSLIMVTSDHGEFFGEHDRLGHGGDLYETVIRVPLLVKYPGARETGIREDRVSLVDLMPTILEEANIPVPPDLDGKSLNQGSRPVIAELYPSADRVRAFGDKANRVLLAYYDGPWKLVRESHPNGDEFFSLFNVETDPEESTNQYESQPEVAARLEPSLKAWYESAVSRRLPETDQADIKMDPAHADMMKGLGYIGNN